MSKAVKLTVLGLLSSVVLPSTVLATPPGCPTTRNERHYIGGSRLVSSPSRYWGISGAIETSTLDLCPGTSTLANATAAWVGIDNNNTSSFGWVQTGYVRYSTFTSSHVYMEARNPAGSGGNDSNNPGRYFYYQTGVTPSGVNTYKIDLDWRGTNTSSFWRYYLNGSQTLTLGYNQVPTSPINAQAKVEVVNPANQIPGTNSNHVSFGSILSKSTTTGGYANLSLYRSIDTSIASHAKTDMTNPDSAWFVWDSRY